MKVSILVPAYNAAKYLNDCIRSIISQTYKDLQIIIIDDGSTDNTFIIANEYAEKDFRLEVYSQSNLGVAITRNNLLDKAIGDYILFVDADDWLEPEMVEILVSMVKVSGAEIAMCKHISQSDSKITLPIKSNKDFKLWNHYEIIKKFLYHRELTGSLCNKLVKKSIFHRFTPGISYGEDAMVMWQILLNTSKLVTTDNQYYNYRMNSDSVSHSGGLIKKMSILPVWSSILDSIPNDKKELRMLAEARFGAEISLVLFEAAKTGLSNTDKNIQILNKNLRFYFPSMRKSHSLSNRFLLFSVFAMYNWAFTKFLCRIIRI